MKNILVNVAGRILGPYTSEEVVRSLLEKRLLSIHEVLWPGGRWLSISAHPQFAEVCAKLVDLDISSENIEELTHSLTSSSVTVTSASLGADDTKTVLSSLGHTQTVLNSQIDQTQRFLGAKGEVVEEEGTCIFFPEDGGPSDKKQAEAKSLSLDSSPSVSRVASVVKRSRTKVYVSPSDQREKLSVWKLNKFWWIGLCLFFIAVLIFFWKHQSSKVIKKQQVSLSLARHLLESNQFKQSLKQYKELITFSELNHIKLSESVYKNYALLLLSVEQDSFEVDLLIKGPLAGTEHEGQLLILSALSSGDNKKALGLLKKIDNKTNVDWLNLAATYYSQALYLQSLNILKKLQVKESVILTILIYIKLYNKTLNSAWLLKAKYLSHLSLKDSFYYRQKISLLKVYIQLLSGEGFDKNDVVFILNQDPYMESGMRKNLSIYSHIWSWRSLYSYCEQLVTLPSVNLNFKALNAFCLSKAEKKPESWEILLESLDKSQNILVGAVLAYIYKVENLVDKYIVKLAHLTESLHAKDSALLVNLELRYCLQKKNKECIKNSIRDLLSLNPKALFALTLRMKLYKNKGLKSEVEKMQQFFKAQVPDYRPFLNLKN